MLQLGDHRSCHSDELSEVQLSSDSLGASEGTEGKEHST